MKIILRLKESTTSLAENFLVITITYITINKQNELSKVLLSKNNLNINIKMKIDSQL